MCFTHRPTYRRAGPARLLEGRAHPASHRAAAALERLRQAGINTIADPTTGFETYVLLRERWDGHIARLRTSMMYDADEIDAPTYRPEVVGARPPFERRLRDV